MLSGLTAVVASTTPSLALTIAGGPFGSRTLAASSNSATVFQGVSGASALSPGMFLNVDSAIQTDGSLLATRIELEDASAMNDSSGPVLQVYSGAPFFQLYGRNELGALQTIGGQSGIYFDIPYFGLNGPTFRITGQFTNLQSLPFVPSFNASNLVAGQNVDITSGNFLLVGGTPTIANTVTLVPQTIDGTVVASQPSGGFVDYTVSLPPYNLFPTLANQQGQTTLLKNPSQVEVYVDSSTQQLNTQTLASGNTFRFYGLVFNDNGTLRMDCSQVNDGVSVTPQANSSAHAAAGQSTIIHSSGILHQLVITQTAP